MFAAIFNAAGSYAEIQIGMADFGVTAGLATMERFDAFFLCFSRRNRRDVGIASIPRGEMSPEFLMKEKEVIEEGCDE